jgi:formylglycine-generating enzyme required for sulfatase activity
MVACCGLAANVIADDQAATKEPAAAKPVQKLVRNEGEFKAYWQEIPSAAFKFSMLPVPGSADGSIPPLYVAKTELTWEAFDVWAYRLDEKGEQTPSPQQSGAPDAATRPSKPYLPPDRGFGHEGYAAISLTFRSAETFCAWLSNVSGLKYRLPTEAEWEHACLAGQSGDFGFEGGEEELGRYAWFEGNSDEKPHAAATKRHNAWGLYDMHGNVQEWVVGRDGKPTTKGGSWRDPPEMLKAGARQKQDSSWNASDPNLPKSRWWLSDGSFVGFRVVCEVGADGKPARIDGATAPAERPEQK